MNRKNLIILLLAALVLFLVLSPRASGFGVNSSGSQGAPAGFNTQNTTYAGASSGQSATSDVDMAPTSSDYNSVDAVTSASLIPREVVQTEDFGQFSPEKILTNQNYLDPRSQIGYPETIGGVLRNANRDFRSEPINPRTPVSIFNLSTIPPDTMRPKFEIGSEYA
jgi:hypothetical protein